MKKKGFMLQELILSFVFLIMFILINLSIYGNTAKSINRLERLTFATSNLIERLEEISITDYDNLVSIQRAPLLQNSTNYYITTEVVEQSNPSSIIVEGYYEDSTSAGNISVNLTGYEDMIKLVTITISYKLPGQNIFEDISVTTLKVRNSLIPIEV